MFGKLFGPQARLPRRAALALAGLAVAAVLAVAFRGRLAQPAIAQPPTATPPPFKPNPEDYAARVVAYVHGTAPITRQELGEYLVQRMGADRLPTLLNKHIVDRECAARGISISPAEVDAALAEKMRGLAVDKATFIKTVLARHKKTLVEFKEDELRPNLQMARLVRARLDVDPEDLRKAYESAYGEKVECRLILWPDDKHQAAQDAYGHLRDSEEAFHEAASKQPRSDLASSGGKLKPIARYAMDKEVEEAVFRLRPGQVTSLIRTPQGIALFKCDKRIPPDTTASFEAVREKLAAEMRELKLTQEMAKAFQAMRAEAKPQVLLKRGDRVAPGPMPSPTEPVAYLWGHQAVTREELGEFLIQRFGPEKLPYLVNRRVIDIECSNRRIAVTEEEIDKDLNAYLASMKMDAKVFEKDMLARMGKNLLEWRKDVIRPKLLLGKLAEGRARCTEDDLKQGFAAYYGERMQCRMILWPPDQHRFALSQYTQLRDSEAEFDRAAKIQPTPSLAAKGGQLPPFGRNSLGDEALERKAFKLQPGEVSALIGTAQGHVLIKCDRRIPADPSVTLDQVRSKLTAEVLEKKHQAEMQAVFKELYDKANPRLLLRSADTPIDLAAESKKLLDDK